VPRLSRSGITLRGPARGHSCLRAGDVRAQSRVTSRATRSAAEAGRRRCISTKAKKTESDRHRLRRAAGMLRRLSIVAVVVPLFAGTVRTIAAPGVRSQVAEGRAARAVRYLRFQTGTDHGQHYPAVICTIASLGEQQLYCWTPNDGYTITMLGYPIGSGQVLPNSDRPRRVGADERRNRHRVLRGAAFLQRGAVERVGGFTCISRPSGLTCRNAGGHGWRLPRYVGLPQTF
jgi:hypothetical protein